MAQGKLIRITLESTHINSKKLKFKIQMSAAVKYIHKTLDKMKAVTLKMLKTEFAKACATGNKNSKNIKPLPARTDRIPCRAPTITHQSNQVLHNVT